MWIWLDMYGKLINFPCTISFPISELPFFGRVQAIFRHTETKAASRSQQLAEGKNGDWANKSIPTELRGLHISSYRGSCNSHLFYIIYKIYYIILGKGASLYSLVPCRDIVKWKHMIRLEWCVPLGHPGVTKGSLVSDLINFEVAFICFQT